MDSHLDYLHIEHFKSLKEVRMNCRRVNVFIGEPNVGKSNILEAVALLGIEYERNRSKFLSSFVRYDKFPNLFYDNDFKKTIRVGSNLGGFLAKCFWGDGSHYQLVSVKEIQLLTEVERQEDEAAFRRFADRLPGRVFCAGITRLGEGDALVPAGYQRGPVKKYNFQALGSHAHPFAPFLLPPHGDNLFAVLFDREDIYDEFVPIFEKYGQQLVLDTEDTSLRIEKNVKGRVYSYPYASVADTLQRLIFYLTAIESNKESVLVFEEPEAHSFPPYTQMLAERIANDETNQYFLTTHSPYLLKTIIEHTPAEDLNVSIVYYDQYQTKVKPLSRRQLREGLDEDIFFNLDMLAGHAE